MINVTLRDKIGQMLLIGFDGEEVDDNSVIVQQMQNYAIGGVILFDYDFKTKNFTKNIVSPQQVKKLNQDLQEYNSIFNKKNNRPDLPLLISVDYEGGSVDRLKSNYGFNKTHAANVVGKMNDDEARVIARDMACTLSTANFNVNFAPVLDVNTNPDNPILAKLGRCFSTNAEEVARYAKIYAHEFLQENIRPVFKHFPGHGSSNADSHLGFVDVTDTWDRLELKPYSLVSDFDKSMIMTAHIINRNLDESGLPATLSSKILTNILRDELKFKGVIISDDMQMKAIYDNYSLEESLPLAINAGVDMFIFGNQLVDQLANLEEIIDIIVTNVQRGVIAEKTINASYMRIVEFKRGL